MQKGSEGAASLAEEQTQVIENFNSSIEEMSLVVKNSVADSTEKLNFWVSSQLSTLNKESLVVSNDVMEKIVHKQITTTHLLSNVS